MNRHDDCGCSDLLARLFQLLDAELEDGEHERLARHVSACPDCFHATEAEEHIRALIRRSCEEHAPASLRVRVMTQIQVLRLGGPGVSR